MAIKKRPLSPRQKMINLMYVVLMALLALNVSTEVLDGFSVVEDSLRRTAQTSSDENRALYAEFAAQMDRNPQKVRPWFDRARQVRQWSDSLFHRVEQLKVAIVREADGADGDVRHIRNKEDLEAAKTVMLTVGSGQGEALRQAITRYRERMLTLLADSVRRRTVAQNLSTTPSAEARAVGQNWQESLFGHMPVAAAVTLLTKLQNDVRHAEGEVLHTLMDNIDRTDLRVNSVSALVIPESQTVVRGGRFSARIVMAAVDTTQQPQVFIGGRPAPLQDGRYETTASRAGDFTLSGFIQMPDGRGSLVRRDFSQKYTVVEPSATVSASLMNVLYAGYDNPLSISVPGVPLTQVQATMSGGTLRSVAPGRYIARPATPGSEVSVTVTSTHGGRAQQMGRYAFRVRRLPDPAPYITVTADDGTTRFHGGALAKARLVAADGIGAAIDDGILDVPFRVQQFETVFFDNMGNAVPMVSQGARFSARQKDVIRHLQRNRRFYVSRVTATGPDGTVRKLSTSMEIIVK